MSVRLVSSTRGFGGLRLEGGMWGGELVSRVKLLGMPVGFNMLGVVSRRREQVYGSGEGVELE